MFAGQRADSFQFKDDLVFDTYIGKEITSDLTPEGHFQGNVLLYLLAGLKKRNCKRLLICAFKESRTKFIKHCET